VDPPVNITHLYPPTPPSLPPCSTRASLPSAPSGALPLLRRAYRPHPELTSVAAGRIRLPLLLAPPSPLLYPSLGLETRIQKIVCSVVQELKHEE
jgi:hypothetical protein